MSDQRTAQSRPFLKIFGAGETAHVDKVAEVACKNGYAVIPVKPNSKIPICTLNQTERKAADKAAQEQGIKRHACGITEYITDPAKALRVFARLSKSYAPERLNIGIVAHPSRIITVDCDQSAEVAAFQQQWATETGDAGYLTHTPTVMSPGVFEGEEWIHKGGGHYHFLVPEGIELPERPGYLKDAAGFDIKWGMSQALVPPSVRPEGAYEPTGGDLQEAPEWLMKRIEQRVRTHAVAMAAKALLVPNDGIAQWSQATDWADLLLPDGWTETHKTAECGCPHFTRPGGGTTSWKSATAHNNDCPTFAQMEGHGLMHLWTTNAPAELQGKADWTKFGYVAAMSYGGDVAAAREALDIPKASAERDAWIDGLPKADEVVQRELEKLAAEVDDAEDEIETSAQPSTLSEIDQYLTDKGVSKQFWQDVKDAASKTQVRDQGKALTEFLVARDKLMGVTPSGLKFLKGEALIEELNKPIQLKPTIGFRVDGRGLLYEGRVSVVAGEPGAGKSWMALTIASQVLGTGGSVLVLDLEDTPALSGSRLRSMGTDVNTAVTEGRLVYMDMQGSLDRGDFSMLLRAIEDLRPTFIVLDSANEFVSQFGDIVDNTLITKVYGGFARACTAAGSAMLIVDHVAKNAETKSAIGAQAKQAALTGTFFHMEQLMEFSPSVGGKALVSINKKDRLGGIADYAINKQVAVLTMVPTLVAEYGGDIFDGKAMTFEVIPEGGVDTSDKTLSPEDAAVTEIMEFFGKPENVGQSFVHTKIRDGISTRLRDSIDPALKRLVNDGLLTKTPKAPIRYTKMLELDGAAE